MRFRFIIVVLVMAAGLITGFIVRSQTAGKAAQSQFITSVTGSFTGRNDRNSIVLLSPVKDVLDSNYIEIFLLEGNSRKLLWKSPPSPIRTIELADVNGDGVDELAITLYKSEPKDPKKDNRLHIYGWYNGEIYALWRGTFLSKPFDYLTFGNVTGGEACELVTVEHGRLQKDRYYLCVYAWNGFGFDLLTEAELDNKPRSLSIPPEKDDMYTDIEVSGHLTKTRYSIIGMMLERKGAVR
ncbi:hypothetical protein ACFL60_09045 [Candidatus Omnitrophota bacterium]